MPKLSPSIGIECIEAVMLGRNDEDVPQSSMGDFQVMNIQRLCIDFPIYVYDKQLAERLGIYVLRRQDFLKQILSSARVVVVPGQDVLSTGRDDLQYGVDED